MKTYKVRMEIKDSATGELVEVLDQEWPETVYKLYKAQSLLAKRNVGRMVGRMK